MQSVTTVPTSATGPWPSDRSEICGVARRPVAVFAAAYVLVPVETVVRDSAGVVVELAAVALIIDGVRRYRPRAATAWLLIAGGLLAWAVGDAVWVAYTLADEDPFRRRRTSSTSGAIRSSRRASSSGSAGARRAQTFAC